MKTVYEIRPTPIRSVVSLDVAPARGDVDVLASLAAACTDVDVLSEQIVLSTNWGLPYDRAEDSLYCSHGINI